MTGTDTELIEVRLLGLPLDVLMRARMHSDEVTRELEHITSPTTDQGRLPERLLELSQRLRGQYADYSGAAMDEIETATERGEKEMDVVYRLPPSAGEGARLLGQMWDAVDELCREGAMLSLETPPEAKLFRRWFLDQFITQIGGVTPVSWTEYGSRFTTSAGQIHGQHGPPRDAQRDDTLMHADSEQAARSAER